MARPRSGLSPASAAAATAASSALLLAASLTAPAHAATFELKPAPLHSRTPGGPCPQSLSLVETQMPYREGSYGVTGRAPLAAIATGWRVSNRDAFSVIWTAALRPAFARCSASAGIVRADNAPFKDHSYLRLRFSGGQLQLILDMTGLRDPNDYTPQILSAGVSQGLPVWSWGGSD